MTTGTPHQKRGWVPSSAVNDLAEVSRAFQRAYGLRVASFVVLRHSKGGLTQIEAEVVPPSRWWLWFGRRPPVSSTSLTADE